MSYQPGDPQQWNGRKDPSGKIETYYWHQVVRCVAIDDLKSSERKEIAFLGYASDEGVRRNQGRVGARQGPDVLRAAISRLALHFDPLKNSLFDVGNVITSAENLEASQAELGHKVSSLLVQDLFPIVLGGGHEVAYGHYSGIRKHAGDDSIGIINLDAHFDLRPYPNGPHSGSPFRQILNDCDQNGQAFHYLPIGINPAVNQKALFDIHKNVGQQYILEKDIHANDLQPVFNRIREFANGVDHIYLTLDLDVFPAAHAPGVSAPAAFGLEPEVVRQFIQAIFNTRKVISFDIAELNPTYDDGRTARLAASLIYEVVMQYFNSPQ
jgi:formiminoglutamase